MAKIEVLYWKDIPSQVRGRDADGRFSRMLPHVYQDAIDKAAMLVGEASTDDYLEGWHWEVSEHEGPAQQAVDAVAEALLADYPEWRLREMIQKHAQSRFGS